jgi:hypothetical protein
MLMKLTTGHSPISKQKITNHKILALNFVSRQLQYRTLLQVRRFICLWLLSNWVTWDFIAEKLSIKKEVRVVGNK